MLWTPDGYIRVVIGKLHCKFNDGWPEEVPFANPSSLEGGVTPLRRLLDLWKRGILKIVVVDAEDLERAKNNPSSMLPNAPPHQNPSPHEAAPRAAPLVLHPVDFHDLSRPPLADTAAFGTLTTTAPVNQPRRTRRDQNKAHHRPVTGRRPRASLRGLRSAEYVYEALDEREAMEGTSRLEPQSKRLRVALTDEFVEVLKGV